MFTTILAGAAAAPAPATNFDILHAMNEGGVIAWGTAAILTVMLFFSLFILFTKVFEQQKVLNQYQRVRATFWQSGSLREGAAKLEKNSAYRQIVDDALLAREPNLERRDEARRVPRGAILREAAPLARERRRDRPVQDRLADHLLPAVVAEFRVRAVRRVRAAPPSFPPPPLAARTGAPPSTRAARLGRLRHPRRPRGEDVERRVGRERPRSHRR